MEKFIFFYHYIYNDLPRCVRISSKNGQSRFQDCPFILLIMRFFLACTDFCIK